MNSFLLQMQLLLTAFIVTMGEHVLALNSIAKSDPPTSFFGKDQLDWALNQFQQQTLLNTDPGGILSR